MTTAPADLTFPAIEISSLEISYSSHAPILALTPTTFAVYAGQWLALLGPNGSGKSSLLRAVATLTRPTAGSIRIFGHDPATSPDAQYHARAAMGIIFQSTALDALLTVRENLTIAAAAYGVPNAQSRIRDVATSLGIADRLDDRVGTLSGGLARRADLARALLPRPRLLLLDEPTTGLDLESRLRFLDTLTSLRRREGLTIVYATHHMDEAEHADRVIMMSRGSVVADDSPEMLTKRHTGVHIHCDDPVSPELAARLKNAPIAHPDELQQLVAELLHAGARFRVGPATLADAYLDLTGTPLEQPS